MCAEDQAKVNTRADFEAPRIPYEAEIKRTQDVTNRVRDPLPILSQRND